MNNKEIYNRLIQCAETEINDWKKCDKLTPIEQNIRYCPVVSGIARAALFLLPTEDYSRFKEEITKMGAII